MGSLWEVKGSKWEVKGQMSCVLPLKTIVS